MFQLRIDHEGRVDPKVHTTYEIALELWRSVEACGGEAFFFLFVNLCETCWLRD
jgi:hypothetical protein